METFKKHWKPVLIGTAALLVGYLAYKWSIDDDTVKARKRGPFQSVIAGTVNWEAT